MSRFIDERFNTLSCAGRLAQVEYAMEAVGRSSPCLAIKCADGIVMTAENRHASILVDLSMEPAEKIFKISKDIICGVSGLLGDGQKLVHNMRITAAKYECSQKTPIRVEGLAQRIGSIKHAYTLYGGPRPYGASLLIAGWDNSWQYELFQTDPSGNCSGWKATAIGKDFSKGMRVLNALIDEKSPPTIVEAKIISVKAMAAMLEQEYFRAEKIEMMTLRRRVEQTTVIERVPNAAMEILINDYKKAELEAEAAKKKINTK